MDKKNVVFVCTANRARSQIAEALLRHRAAEFFNVHSCGSIPEKTVHPLAVKTLAVSKIDISNAKTKGYSDLNGTHFDYIISVCDTDAEDCSLVFAPNSTKVNWRLPDPDKLLEPGTDDEVALKIFEKTKLEILDRIDTFVNVYRSGILSEMTPHDKKRKIEKIHHDFEDTEKSRYISIMMKAHIVKPEDMICVPKSEATNLVSERVSEIRHSDIYSSIALSLSLGLA